MQGTVGFTTFTTWPFWVCAPRRAPDFTTFTTLQRAPVLSAHTPQNLLPRTPSTADWNAFLVRSRKSLVYNAPRQKRKQTA